MKLLLDTHMVIWAAEGCLPKRAEALITDKDNTLYFSAANIWEITVKVGIGRQDFYYDPAVLRQELLAMKYLELAITSEHCLMVGSLPMFHKDPFDRILLAQATTEGIPLLTSDTLLRNYQVPMIYIPKAS